MDLILKFLFLTALVSGAIIFFLHRTLISSTEGAVKRLNDEIGKATAKQAELTRKLREADEELSRRQTEARQLAEKMRTDAENESKEEREKIIKKAREEGEEIIAKAQGAKEKMRTDLEKEMDGKGIDFGMQILNNVLSEKAKGNLDQVLIGEFLENLKTIDMSRISSDVKEVEVISLTQPTEDLKKQVVQIVKSKINRDISVAAKVDSNIGGGLILKFGSMALDGSVRNLMRDVVTSMKKDVEARA
jgi:F0F1-type ATP synthase membrane subunit b/b'